MSCVYFDRKPPAKKGKLQRDWGLNGNPRDTASLDFSDSKQPVESTDPDLEREVMMLH